MLEFVDLPPLVWNIIMSNLDGTSIGALACTGSAASDMIDDALGRKKKPFNRNTAMSRALAAVVCDAIRDMVTGMKQRPVTLGHRRDMRNTYVTHLVRLDGGHEVFIRYGIIPCVSYGYGYVHTHLKAYWFVNVVDTSNRGECELAARVIKRTMTSNNSDDGLAMREIRGIGLYFDKATDKYSMTGPAPSFSGFDVTSVTRVCSTFVEQANIASTPAPTLIHGSLTPRRSDAKMYFDRMCNSFGGMERLAKRYNIRHGFVPSIAEPSKLKSSNERVLIKGSTKRVVYKDSHGMRYILVRGAYVRIESIRRLHANTFAVIPSALV